MATRTTANDSGKGDAGALPEPRAWECTASRVPSQGIPRAHYGEEFCPIATKFVNNPEISKTAVVGGAPGSSSVGDPLLGPPFATAGRAARLGAPPRPLGPLDLHAAADGRRRDLRVLAAGPPPA